MTDSRFKASWWLRPAHAQTLWASVVRKVKLRVRTEQLELPDGDFVPLDWVGDATSGPIVVVLPGLQGDVQSSPVRGILKACESRGWRGVLLNYRGHLEPNRFVASYHCGKTCDLDYLVRRLHEREPHTPIGVVGLSVGANICLKWLGESGQRGQTLPVAATVMVSAPFHLGTVARKIENGFSRIYQKHLLKSLHTDVERKMRVLDVGLGLTPDELPQLNTFVKFDERISAPINGFLNAADYYEKTRTDTLLHHINIPTLIINARNDPLVPAHLIPLPENVSPQVTLETPRNGGHMGFITGRRPWAPRYWLDQRVPDSLAAFF